MTESTELPRVIWKSVDELGVSITEHVSVTKHREGQVVGFVETERDGLAGRADVSHPGSALQALTGKPPLGESHSLLVAWKLVQHLNANGAHWAEPCSATEPADCESVGLEEDQQVLRMQIVRAVSDPSLWFTLHQDGQHSADWSADALAQAVRTTIDTKARRYGAREKLGLVLVLDANRLPVFSLTSVRDAIVTAATAAGQLSGFEAVWLVGPTPDLCYRVWPA